MYVPLQKIENIESLTGLDSLYLGKNKISVIENVQTLTNLTVLDIQVREHPDTNEPDGTGYTGKRQDAGWNR